MNNTKELEIQRNFILLLHQSNLIKFLRQDMNHFGFQYKEGLNVDTNVFYPRGSCLGGGLYFTTHKHRYNYCGIGPLIADVEIPLDAKVYSDPCGTKWKSDRIILKNIRSHCYDSQVFDPHDNTVQPVTVHNIMIVIKLFVLFVYIYVLHKIIYTLYGFKDQFI